MEYFLDLILFLGTSQSQEIATMHSIQDGLKKLLDLYGTLTNPKSGLRTQIRDTVLSLVKIIDPNISKEESETPKLLPGRRSNTELRKKHDSPIFMSRRSNSDFRKKHDSPIFISGRRTNTEITANNSPFSYVNKTDIDTIKSVGKNYLSHEADEEFEREINKLNFSKNKLPLRLFDDADNKKNFKKRNSPKSWKQIQDKKIEQLEELVKNSQPKNAHNVKLNKDDIKDSKHNRPDASTNDEEILEDNIQNYLDDDGKLDYNHQKTKLPDRYVQTNLDKVAKLSHQENVGNKQSPQTKIKNQNDPIQNEKRAKLSQFKHIQKDLTTENPLEEMVKLQLLGMAIPKQKKQPKNYSPQKWTNVPAGEGTLPFYSTNPSKKRYRNLSEEEKELAKELNGFLNQNYPGKKTTLPKTGGTSVAVSASSNGASVAVSASRRNQVNKQKKLMKAVNSLSIKEQVLLKALANVDPIRLADILEHFLDNQKKNANKGKGKANKGKWMNKDKKGKNRPKKDEKDDNEQQVRMGVSKSPSTSKPTTPVTTTGTLGTSTTVIPVEIGTNSTQTTLTT